MIKVLAAAALIVMGIAIAALVTHALRTKRCTTALERSYLNEQWNYSCPIDPPPSLKDLREHATTWPSRDWPKPMSR
jgi:hypothetical protein